MSCRDRDDQSLIRVTDGAGARLHMQHTRASARTHTRARRHSQHGSHDRNAWTQESHAECESK